MRTLVSGASGLVGAAAVAALAARGHQVRALVRRGSAPAAAAETLVGDVRDADSWRRALAGVDAVVHAAGAMTQDQASLTRVNVEGTAVACAAAREAGCPRLVLLSSTAVYAPGPMLDADETWPLAPGDAYGRSKLEGERHARAVLGERLTVLRPVSVYATHRPSPFLAAVRAVGGAGRVPLVGDGGTPIDLVHADDLAAAIVATAEGQGAGGTFNLPGAEPAPFLELARLAAACLGVDLEAVPVADGAPGEGWLYEVASVPRTVSGRAAGRALAYRPARAWRREIGAALSTPR